LKPLLPLTLAGAARYGISEASQPHRFSPLLHVSTKRGCSARWRSAFMMA